MAIIFILVFCLLFATGWLFHAMRNPVKLPSGKEWIELLSMETYKPALQLLDPQVILEFRKRPDYSLRKELQFRFQRYVIVRGYLEAMTLEFDYVATALGMILARSNQDRPELARSLLEAKLHFTWNMDCTRVFLFLYRYSLVTRWPAQSLQSLINVNADFASALNSA